MFVVAAVSQFIPPPTDLITTKGFLDIPVRYKRVPTGICELDPDVKRYNFPFATVSYSNFCNYTSSIHNFLMPCCSFSGYVDIAENEHSFFWFFEARNTDPKEAPLTVWINGGPGSSSMIGLFQENGPCGVNPAGEVTFNPFSWNNVSNMIYIDEPTQVSTTEYWIM